MSYFLCLFLGVVGFLAHTKGVRVEDAVDAGPALAFIVSTTYYSTT